MVADGQVTQEWANAHQLPIGSSHAQAARELTGGAEASTANGQP
jgi:hypothetical protein